MTKKSNKKQKGSKKETKTSSQSSSKKTQKQQTQKQAEQLQEIIAKNQSFEITLSWDKIKPVYHKKLQKEAKQLKLKGFRQGKVPTALAEKKVNQEKLMNLVLQELLPEAYQKALEDSQHQPLTRPQFQALSVNKDNDWKIKAIFATKPEINLKNYKEIAQKAKKQAEKKIEEQEKEQAEQQKEKKSKKDEKDEKKAKEKESEKLTEQQKQDIKIQTIFSQLVQELKPQVPEMILHQSTERELQNLKQRLQQLNVSLEDYVQSHNMTMEQLTSQVALSSLNQLQVEFLLGAIAEQEEIKVTDEDVEQRINEVEDEQMKAKMAQDKNYQSYLKSILLKQKVIQHLLEL
jgi:FKBP-type peptidyl-prolyl cis-trans isomerase (trigger factor)